MSAPERVAVTVPEDVAAEIQIAIEQGEYASSSDVVQDALRAWKSRRALELAELKKKIAGALVAARPFARAAARYRILWFGFGLSAAVGPLALAAASFRAAPVGLSGGQLAAADPCGGGRHAWERSSGRAGGLC